MVSRPTQAGEVTDPNNSPERIVTIELAKLDVNDSSLGLSYKIRNDSDHDVWVCTEVSSAPFEVFVTQDKQTLLIRKQLDVPSTAVWKRPPAAGTYVRLSPGKAYPESLLLHLPVTPRTVYASENTEVVAQTMRRLVLEIGYYDQDLPALVHSIFKIADGFRPESWDLDWNIRKIYFPGLAVRGALADFDDINKDPYGVGQAYVEYSYQALIGEKVLRMEINGVAIPYRSRIKR
jgi:hypothetical protein